MLTRPVLPFLQFLAVPAPDAPPRALEMLPVAFYACDREGRILWFNQKAAQLWQRTPALGDGGERFCGFVKTYANGQEIAREATEMAKALRTGVAVDGIQSIVERPDGSRIRIMMHIEPVRDEQGELIGALNCFHNATAVHGNDSDLHASDQHLAATHEHAAIGISEVDADGRRLRVNEAACAILGYSREQMTNACVFDATHSEDRARDIEQHRQLVDGATDRYAMEKRAIRGDGRVIWLSLVASAVRDDTGSFLYSVCVFHDITEAKRAIAALAENEQRLAATYQHAAIGISEVDASGRLVRVNETVCRITGYSEKELLNLAVFDVTHPDDRTNDRNSFERQIAGIDGSYTVEKRLVCKDGRVIWASVTSSSVSDSAGRFLYGIRVLQDITDRKLAEARQKALIDELNHRVKNTLATVQSLAAQTLRGSEATAKARDDFNARLFALSKAHDQLSRAGWRSADFQSIVEGIFAPYRIQGGNQVRLTGPSVRLPPNAALLLAMIIHELATNAAKYGALSAASGMLDLNWATVKRDDCRHLVIEWRESGGPPVRAPKRRGFGNRLAHRAITHELNGSAQIMFEPAGVRCRFEIPLAISPE
jgi:PAS domain S-box-containing protein